MAEDNVALAAVLSARLDKFEKDMKRAGVIADDTVKDIENRFGNANPQFKATFLGSFFGNLASQATSGVLSFITDAFERFKKLETNARLAGVAMNDLFGFEEAGKSFKAPIDEIQKFERNLAQLTDEAKRGDENSLTKLFEQLKPLIGDVDLKTLTWQKSVGYVADGIKQAGSEVQKVDMAKAAGGSEALVKFLEQGSVKIGEIQKKAADSAPDLQKMANLAKEFDAAVANIVETLKAGLVGALHEAAGKWAEVFEKMAAFIEQGRDWARVIFKTEDVDGMIGRIKGIAAALRDVGKESDTVAAKSSEVTREGAKRGNLANGKGTTTADPNRPVINFRTSEDKDAKDAFDRASDQAQKAIDLRNAEAAAVGQSAGEHARLRTEAGLLAIAQRDGAEATDAQKAKIKELGELAAQAATKFEQAQYKFQGQQEALRFAGQTASTEIQALIDKSKSLGDVLVSVLKKIAAELINAGLFGGGPLAKLLGLAGEGGKVGGILGGAFGEGGSIEAGQYAIAGERGKPEIISAKNTGLQITPVSKIAGGTSYAITSVNDFRGVSSEMKAWIAAQLRQRDQQLPNMIAATMPTLRQHSKLR